MLKWLKRLLGDRTKYALQTEQLGTGHAVLLPKSYLVIKMVMTLIACEIHLFSQQRHLKNYLNITNLKVR